MSERTVYAIASGKGGVGKTTTAINLGAMLADRGNSVVVVDTDLGMANLADFLDFEIETPTLHEVLAGDADPDEAIYRAPGDIDVLPSATDIEAFVRSNPANLDDVVADLRGEYDYVLLDTGAGVSYDTLVPLALADAVLLVATPDVASVRDTAKTGELAERVESDVRGAVLTQRSSDILNADDVEETLGADVLAVVPQDEAVPMGIDAGRPLAAFAPNAPAGQAYRDLAAVVTGEAEPDPELDLDDADAADPDDPDDDIDPDALAGPDLAADVREAVDGEGSGGLLGGELSRAAEEIRREVGDEPSGPADAAEAAPSEPAAGANGNAADAGGDVSAGDADGAERPSAGDDGSADEAESAAGASDARSVDDLLDEHISDDRRTAGATFDESGGDPLAGTGDDASADEADDPLAGTDDDGADEADDADGSDPAAEPADGVPFGEGGWSSEQSGRPDGAAEAGGGATAGDAVPGGATGSADEDATAASDGPDADEASESPEDDRGSDERLPEGDSSGADERDEEGGVLGRLGSLFK